MFFTGQSEVHILKLKVNQAAVLLAEDIVAVSIMYDDVGFCSCFSYFETKFNTISLLLYTHYAKCDKTITQS
jgi:hypothetical protein